MNETVNLNNMNCCDFLRDVAVLECCTCVGLSLSHHLALTEAVQLVIALALLRLVCCS